jgi:arabinofuranosyltransferase
MTTLPRWHRAAVGLVAGALLALGIAETAWPWIVDDAFISLRYADRLVAGDGLTWTDGERVEGYSNLLWVLLSAACRAIGIDGVAAVRGLGIACMAATIAVLVRGPLLPAHAPALLAVVIFAALGCTATWTTAGLETPLVLLLLALGFTAVHLASAAPVPGARVPWLRAGVPFGLLVWTRPDAPLWIAVGAAAALLAPRCVAASRTERVRATAWLLALPLAAFAAQMAFRLAYYGEWLPNTAFAKITPSAASRAAGWHYAASNVVALRALLVPAALGLGALFVPRTRALAAFALAGAALWWAYVVNVGGDPFPKGRFVMPSLVSLTVLAACGLAWLASFGRAGTVIAWLVAVGSVGLAYHDARAATTDPLQRLSTWEGYGKATGEWLGRAFAQQRPLVAVDAAGAVPYYSGLPCLDMLGLCDHTIARTPFPADAPFVAAHSRANGAYVVSREPDLVLFGPPPHSPLPQWVGGRQMLASAQFRAAYRLVLFDLGVVRLEHTEPRALQIPAWVHTAGRLGPRPSTTPDAIEVPAFRLGAYRHPVYVDHRPDGPTAVAELRAGAEWLLDPGVVAVVRPGHTEPVAEVRRAGQFELDGLSVLPGRYALRAELPPGATARLGLIANGSVPGSDADSRDSIRVTAIEGNSSVPVPVSIVLGVGAGAPVPFHVTVFVLERVE